MDIQHYINLLNSVPTGFWQLLVASPAVSAIMLGVLHWYQKQHPLIKNIMVYGVSFITVGINYIMGSASSDPKILFMQAALLHFGTQPFYLGMIQPLNKKVQTKLSLAAAQEAELKSAAIPAGGLPISFVTSAPVSDFSE